MATDNEQRAGKLQARQLIDEAMDQMKRRYGGTSKRAAGDDDALVVNYQMLAAAMYIHPSRLSNKLNPNKLDERPDEDQIEIIVTKLEMSEADRQKLRRCYGYESASAGVEPPPPAIPPAAVATSVAPPVPATPNNLPQPGTSFVGRNWVLNRLREQLGRSRLLTVTGLGGCGKTRLCLEYARGVVHEYPGGVWFVDLARLAPGDNALAPSVLAAALNVRERPGVTLMRGILQRLRDQRALILLDNCEHVLLGSATLAGALLDGADQVTVLATSRQALAVSGEQTWELRPLDVPAERPAYDLAPLGQVEAVRLFVERAALSRPRFALTAENASAVVEVCRKLEGMPLALELAAARLRVLSPAQLAVQLKDRFAALSRPQLEVEPRQQTLEAILDWSFDLLTAEEQRLFRRLAVFAGGWNLRQAEAICSGEDLDPVTVPRLLEDLIDKSLVQVDGQEDEARFHMLETVRAYAVARLQAMPEAAPLARRHRNWYVSYLGPAEAALNGPEQTRMLGELAHEGDNVRAAMRNAAEEGEAEAELLLAAGMWKFWHLRGAYSEGRRALTDALTRGETAPALLRAKVYSAAGILATEQGDLAEASHLTEQCMAIREQEGDRLGVARSQLVLGRLARMQGDWGSAEKYWDMSLTGHRALKERQGEADALVNLGIAAAKRGDYTLARARFAEGKAILRELGDRLRYAMALDNEGSAALEQGDYAAARSLHGECLELARGPQDPIPWLVAAEYLALGRVALLQNDTDLARSLLGESLKLRTRMKDVAGIAACERTLAAVAAHTGALLEARERCATSLEATRAIGDREGTADALLTLASITAREGGWERARALYREALDLCVQAGYRLGMVASLEGVARLLAESGQVADAARLCAVAAAAREAMGTPVPEADRAVHRAFLRTLEERAETAVAASDGGGRNGALEAAAASAARLL